MVGCSRSYCIFPNALVMQFYDTQSVTNIDFTSKTNNSWYKSPITAWKIPFERYDSYLSPNKKKQTHYPFFHIYFNGFLPPFNFLLHHWTVAYTDNILIYKRNICSYVCPCSVHHWFSAQMHIQKTNLYSTMLLCFQTTSLSRKCINCIKWK